MSLVTGLQTVSGNCDNPAPTEHEIIARLASLESRLSELELPAADALARWYDENDAAGDDSAGTSMKPSCEHPSDICEDFSSEDDDLYFERWHDASGHRTEITACFGGHCATAVVSEKNTGHCRGPSRQASWCSKRLFRPIHRNQHERSVHGNRRVR